MVDNILATVDNLKRLDQQQLMAVRGHVPDYIWAAEMASRDQMNKAYEADKAHRPPQSTVIEDLQRKMQPPPQMGPPPMGQPGMPPQGPPPQPQMGPPPPPQGGGVAQMMAGGGMVRMAGGGGLSRVAAELALMRPEYVAPDDVNAPPMTVDQLMQMAGPRMTAEDAASNAKVLMGSNDYLSPIMAELAAQKAAPVVGKPSVWQALMRAGAAMMASRNPSALGGTGEGVMAALEGYNRDRDAYRQDQTRVQDQGVRNLLTRANLAEAQQRQQNALASLGGQQMSNASHEWNTVASALMGARTQGEANRTHKEIASSQLAEQKRLHDSQIGENDAQAEERNRNKRIFQSFVKRANGDEGVAFELMNQARNPRQPQERNELRELQGMAIRQRLAKGDDPADVLSDLTGGTRRSDITKRERLDLINKLTDRMDEKFNTLNDPKRTTAHRKAAADYVDGLTKELVIPEEEKPEKAPGFWDRIFGGEKKPAAKVNPHSGGIKILKVEPVV